jgi:hypothetical protein
MNTKVAVLASILFAGTALADPPAPNAASVLQKMLESDPWGLSGASIVAHATLTDKNGAKSELAFKGKSKRLAPTLSESIVRFSAPPDLSGAAFLQIQKNDGDDDRFLYLPDLKRSRRISGNLRANAFMGTDLSFADLDRRDLRDSTATLTGSETIDRWECFVLDVTPKRDDSQYSHVELWIRKDNYLPIRMKLYDRTKTLLKSFTALEMKRVSNQWFISKSRMVNQQQRHTTELFLDRIAPEEPVQDVEFTVRALEKAL